LQKIAWDRILLFSKIVEDMKRRAVWTFPRTDYIHNPKDYRLRSIEEKGEGARPEGRA